MDFPRIFLGFSWIFLGFSKKILVPRSCPKLPEAARARSRAVARPAALQPSSRAAQSERASERGIKRTCHSAVGISLSHARGSRRGQRATARRGALWRRRKRARARSKIARSEAAESNPDSRPDQLQLSPRLTRIFGMNASEYPGSFQIRPGLCSRISISAIAHLARVFLRFFLREPVRFDGCASAFSPRVFYF